MGAGLGAGFDCRVFEKMHLRSAADYVSDKGSLTRAIQCGKRGRAMVTTTSDQVQWAASTATMSPISSLPLAAGTQHGQRFAPRSGRP